MIRFNTLFLFLAVFFTNPSVAQKAYFVDGFHGGVWGHYPKDYTQFIVDQLARNPEWKINLEIEPETWDRARNIEKHAYKTLQDLVKDQSVSARIEFVNPSYAQSYLYTSSGESMIRQFKYGIMKIREHFPGAVFSTYSSEEPCFTSALPQILKSFGFKYASLKNPNTCWGGYTRNFGGELVNWKGPDGTSLLTVPRYETEDLKPGSTWETMGNENKPGYIKAAIDYGIKNPVGMCFQDAGWRFGPWLKGDYYKPSEYTTWRNYFENIASIKLARDWQFSQEDLLVSLVWGSQVLQRIAQRVHSAENEIIKAETLATMAKISSGYSWPSNLIDSAWRGIMLSQHHDCWIVPYNGRKGDTWADKVKKWTDSASLNSGNIKAEAMKSLSPHANGSRSFVRLHNTTSYKRNEWIKMTVPEEWDPEKTTFTDQQGKVIPMHPVNDKEIIIQTEVPAMGFNTYNMLKRKSPKMKGATVAVEKNGDFKIETDLYTIIINPKRGGTISHLIAKSLDHKDFVDRSSDRKFNELRGNFYSKGGFRSSTENEAQITVIERGPARVRLKIEGTLAGTAFSQFLTVTQGQKRIDLTVNLDWKSGQGIGEFEEKDYKATTLHKAFYNDRYKLLTLFPLALEGQQVFKDAPFDVTRSKLKNTFFNTWDSIKNNVMLNWVDINDKTGKYGFCLLTDHTTSYAHGAHDPLGLTTQYSGKSLWGRNYELNGATTINYAIVPHKGNWFDADIQKESAIWNEPMEVAFFKGNVMPADYSRSFVNLNKKGWSVSFFTVNGSDVLLRIYNAGGDNGSGEILLKDPVKTAAVIDLKGMQQDAIHIVNQANGTQKLQLSIPKFGIKTIKLNY